MNPDMFISLLPSTTKKTNKHKKSSWRDCDIISLLGFGSLAF